MAKIRRLAAEHLEGQSASLLMGLGHGATHWIIATIYVLLPFISKDLGLSYAAVGGLITLFHTASFVANAGSGAAVDISGRYVGVACFALVAGALALAFVGFAVNLVWLVLPIIVIGLTNNLWHPAAISFLSRRYPKQRGYALSLHALGATLGDILAPLSAGFLLVVLSWQGTALVNAIPVFGVAAALVIALGRNERGQARNDAKRRNGKSYLQGVRELAANRAIMMLCIMAGFRSMTQNGLLVFLPLYLVNNLGAGPVLVGIAMMSIQVGAIVSGPVAGSWSDRIGRQPVVLGGLILTSLVVAGMSIVSGTVAFLALTCVLGFVMFAIRPVIHGWTMDLTSDDMSGSAVSLLFAVQSALTMLVPIVGGLIADVWGLRSVFYILTATISISVAMAFFLPDPRAAER